MSQPDADLVRDALEQQNAVNAEPEAWESFYGFAHTCKCGDDFAAGNMIEVTACNSGMTRDALSTCAVQQAALKAIAEGVESPELYAQEFTR